jgi:transcription antitermination factor NusG
MSDRDLSQYWIIVRMAASRTRAVTDALRQAGYDAWTPMETVTKRAPRTRVVKARRLVPSMPTYAFVRAIHAFDLAVEIGSPMTTLPAFSIFRHDDRAALIADRDLDPVRITEQQGNMRRTKPLWKDGDMVRVPEGPCAGMSGVIHSLKRSGKLALVAFPGWQVPIEISASLLLPDPVKDNKAVLLSGAASRQDRLAEVG